MINVTICSHDNLLYLTNEYTSVAFGAKYDTDLPAYDYDNTKQDVEYKYNTLYNTLVSNSI